MHSSLLSFNSGEVSPYLRHRIDFEKAASSCEVMRNFLPLPYGAAVKRPGLVSLETVTISEASVLAGENQAMFPFIASTGDKYLLHFMEDRLKIYRTDGSVADSMAFMDGYAWPESPWENGIRALHMVQINDVAFFTHPGSFPLRLRRVNDTEWHLQFIPFDRAPMLDENTDKRKTFTVASDPVADTWANGETYVVGDVVFTNCEWKCTAEHTATSGKKPGTGADWRDYWQRMFYKEGDPVTLLADDREEDVWVEGVWSSYSKGQVRLNGTEFIIATDDHEASATDLTPGDIIGTPVPYQTEYTHWRGIDMWPSDNIPSVSFAIDTGMWLARGGVVYEAIADDASPTSAEWPGTGANTATYWSVVGGITASPGQYTVGETDGGIVDWVGFIGTEYQANDRVSRKGRVYTCLLDHTASSSNRPGSGASWETYWVETSRMVEEWAAGNFSPGQYFRISPERDEQDFQLELQAIGAVDDVTRSENMAVQGAWNFQTYGTWWGTFQLQRSANNGKTWETMRSWQAAGDRNIADSGIEDTPVLLRLKFTKEDGGTTEAALNYDDSPPRGLLIPESPFVTGYCLMDTYTDSDEMTGTAKTAMLSGNTYRWAEGAFNSRDGFPRAIALHESRLCFASTAARPVSMWLSASDDLINFETGVEADDAIYATLALSNASPIRWMSSQRRLFVGTAFGEWVVGSETSDSPTTPTNFIARQYSGYGSHPQQPLIALDATFFVERKGMRLRELAYFSEREAYDAADLTRIADHLTRDGIAAMAWQQTREPGLWIVTRAGALLHFAYSRTERIMAWTRHDTEDGLFRDVVVIPSDDGDDEVFFLVDRTYTELERFPQHWLSAIELADDPVVADTVDDLPITAELVTLPIDMASQDGTTQARRKRLNKVSLSLFHSAGGHLWNADQTKKQPITGSTITTGWVDVVPDSGNLDEVALRIHHAGAQPFILRCATMRFQLHEK